MVEKSSDPQLKQGFQTHLRETENHVKRLEQVFKLIRHEAQGVDCPAIDGILEEASDVAGEVEKKSVLDAALIAAAQAVEHYEMTRYGTLISWAKELGRNNCVALLQQTASQGAACQYIPQKRPPEPFQTAQGYVVRGLLKPHASSRPPKVIQLTEGWILGRSVANGSSALWVNLI